MQAGYRAWRCAGAAWQPPGATNPVPDYKDAITLTDSAPLLLQTDQCVWSGVNWGIDLAVLPAAAVPRPGTSSPYQILLGEAFASLDARVRRGHLVPLAAEGTLDVRHGTDWLTPLMVRLMKLPAAGRGQRVRLDVTPFGADVEWTRRIGSSVLRTRQRAVGPLLVESNGIGCVAFALEVEDGALLYRQVSMRVAGILVPSFVRPRVSARVSPAAEGWRVEVAVTWRDHLVCRYAGVLGVA